MEYKNTQGTFARAEVWDKVSEDYKIEIDDSEYQLADEIISIFYKAGIKPQAKIIELGCGSGHLSACLAMKGYHVTLLDFSEGALNKAKQTFENYGIEGEFVKGDIFDLSSLNEKYDLVWNSGVMEHFSGDNLRKLYQSIMSITYNKFIFLVPNPSSISYLMMRYNLQGKGQWAYGMEYLRTNYLEIAELDGFKGDVIGYVASSMSKWHFTSTFLDSANSTIYSKMIEDGLIPEDDGYLIVYELSNDNEKILEKNDIIIMDSEKEKVFELSAINYELERKAHTYEEKARLLEADVEALVKNKNELEEVKKSQELELCKQNEMRISFEETKIKLEETKIKLEETETKLEETETRFEESQKILGEKNNELSLLLKGEEEKNSQLAEKCNQYTNREENIAEAIKQICALQSTKSYRLSLFMRRFLTQCIKTSDRRDFCKWFFGKLIHKNSKTAKLLIDFDHLEIVKCNLRLMGQINNVTPVVVENAAMKLKETKSVFIFGSVPFYDVGGGQRSAQFAKTYNTLGYRVYYVYGFPCSEENIPDMFIPAVEHQFIDDISCEWFGNIIDKDSIAIFEIPYFKFEPYLDMAKEIGCATVYEHIDNWDSSLGNMFYDEKVFESFLEKTDIITVTARKLGEKIEECSNREYIYLPNAVNTEIFEPLKQYECPKDLVKGKKTLLYFGSLWGEWFEWDKIDYLADNCPDCEINLIGDTSGCMDRVQNAKKNVHFLGLKKQTDLPAYLQYSDVALLPFKNCEIGSYVSPLKIFEYIAMNVRVLATNLDDIQNYPNVFCSDSKEEWLQALNEDVELVDSSAFISKNNWFARCEKLMQSAQKVEKEFPTISIVVLNYNNMRVIRRCVETLLSHKKRYNYEVVVVDNGSSDGSYEMLEENYASEIVLVRNTQNGCSSGRNLGVQNARGRYICFLDSDQWIISDYWLDSALEIMRGDVKIGAVGWNAGWFTPGKTTGPIVDYLPNRGIESASIWYRKDIAYLATSGFLMKKDLFEEIGGFDEFYDPTCFEDTDISLKIRNYGYELAYCPYMAIMHLPHQTTQSGSERHTQLMERNGKYFMEKWKEIQPELLEYYM